MSIPAAFWRAREHVRRHEAWKKRQRALMDMVDRLMWQVHR